MDNIDVQPGERPGKVAVRTVEVNGVHYPVYFLGDENGNILKLDPSAPSVPVIDVEHRLIHMGKVFSLSGKISALAAGTTAYFLGITDGGFVHFRSGQVSSTGTPVDVNFYEEAVVSANGTAVTGQNRNRNSSNTTTLSTYFGPTVTTPGALMEFGLIPQAGPGNTGGLASLFNTEWLLKPSTNYLVGITNNDSNPIDIGYNFIWYEV